jgi:hypothetical protein
MPKVSFFYANGTAYLVNLIELGFSVNNAGIVRIGNKVVSPVASKGYATVAGLNGRTATWDGGPENDPFPFLLDPDVWDAVKISYPAAALGIGPSIDYGVDQTVKAIRALPPGTPFALGGYSQGAAVMSGVYNQIKVSTGALYSRRNEFLGGVMFGNPRRQINHRGEIGGTWSGYWDDPNKGTANAATSGGHGSFPATGPYARLSGADPTKWIEFTAPDDIFSSVGDTADGQAWSTGNDFILGKSRPQIAGQFLTQALAGILGMSNTTWTAVNKAFSLGGVENFFLDAVGQIFTMSGAGHVTYPILGPPTSTGTFTTNSTVKDGKTYLTPVGDSCYQIALRWLEGKATAWATAPVVLGTNSTGWSTTLVPPAP